METIKGYIDAMFREFPDTEEVHKLKQSILESMEDKYQELIQDGKSENEAIGTVIAQFGNIDELKKEFSINSKESDNKTPDIGLVVNDQEARNYMHAKIRNGYMVALGVALIILDVGLYQMIEKTTSEGIANMSFFAIIAFAVGIFIYAGSSFTKYEKYEKTTLQISAQLHQNIQYELDKFNSFQTLMLILSVGIIIMAPAMYPFFEDSVGLPDALLTFIFMFQIMLGVSILIIIGHKKDAYEIILSIKQAKSIAETKDEKTIGLLAAVLFPIAALAYIGLGLTINWWAIGWIIFPICGVIVGAYAMYINMKNS